MRISDWSSDVFSSDLLGLELKHRYVKIGPQDRGRAGERAGDVRRLATSAHRQAGSAAAVDQEAVEGLGERLDAVHVGDERERRLRLSRGDHVRDRKSTRLNSSP